MQTDYQDEASRNLDQLRVSYKFGEAAFEAEGVPDDVNRHAAAFLALVKNGSMAVHSISETNVLMNGISDALLSANNSTPLPNNNVDGSNRAIDSLLTLYMEKAVDPSTGDSIATQFEQLLLISWSHQKFGGREFLELADFNAAYDEVLARVPVPKPANIAARLATLVKRGLLHKVAKGYALTRKGEQAVTGIGNR